MTVTLTPPFTSATRPSISVSPGKLSDAWPASSNNPVHWATYVPATVPNGMDSIVLAIARTAPDPGRRLGSAVAPSGVWQVDFQCSGTFEGRQSVDQALRHAVRPPREGAAVLL